MKVLITGINGFVGRYLFEYIKSIERVTVWGTSRNNERLQNNIYVMDITDKNQIKTVLEEIRPNYIFHFAGQSSVAASWENPQKTIELNVNGTLNLLDCIKEMKLITRVILVGSCEEYGVVPLENQPIDELAALNPLNPYALSKTSQSLAANLYASSYGLDIITVRLFNQIGPGQDSKFVISYFAKRIAEIENSVADDILKVGNLDAIRDFIDIRDAVKLFWQIIQKGASREIYNIGSGIGYKISDLLEILLSFSKKKIIVSVDPERIRPLDVPISICNNQKIKNLVQWKPSINIESSLEDILNFWRESITEESELISNGDF